MWIKGFDKNLRCRGVQFEIGEEQAACPLSIIEPMALCTDTVIHFCALLSAVHEFYSCNDNNRYCVIEPIGEIVTDGVKFGARAIRVVREITGRELDVMKGLTNGNVGFFNSGGWNSGDRNSGDRNSGDFCKGYRNAGVFCTAKEEDTILMFDTPCSMTWADWYAHPAYKATRRLSITEWVSYVNMSDEEKVAHPAAETNEGYLKVYTYEEAWANLWRQLTKDERQAIMSLPNFDADKFEYITGIRV
jgi:hypothetical protein